MQQKSIYDLAIEKGWNLGQLFQNLAGKKVKTIPSTTNNRSGHNHSAVFTFRNRKDLYSNVSPVTGNVSLGDVEANPTSPTSGMGRTSIYPSEIALFENKINKVDLVNERNALEEKLNKQLEDYNIKLKALEELGVEEIEEELLDVVNAVSAVNPKAEAKDKIKLAEALLKVINK